MRLLHRIWRVSEVEAYPVRCTDDVKGCNAVTIGSWEVAMSLEYLRRNVE